MRLRERQPHIRHIHEVNRGPGDYDQFNVYSRCQIIWLHGRAEQYSDKNATGETGALDQGSFPEFVRCSMPHR